LAGRVPLYPGDSRVALSPDGSSFATVTEDHKLRGWDARTRAECEVVAIDFLLRSLRWEAGGELVVTGDGGPVVRYRPGTAAPRDRGCRADGLCGPGGGGGDGGEYRGRGNQGVLRLTDAPTGAERWSRVFEDVVDTVDLSPDGRLLAFAAMSSRVGVLPVEPRGCEVVYVIDLVTGRDTGQLVGHTNRVRRVSFAPDGRAAYTAGADGTVRRWRIRLLSPSG
jgi:WD40 repeat protein